MLDKQLNLKLEDDCLNRSFVKDKHVVGKQMARYGLFISCYFLEVGRTCTGPQDTSEAITFDPIKI